MCRLRGESGQRLSALPYLDRVNADHAAKLALGRSLKSFTHRRNHLKSERSTARERRILPDT
jgi:hypothetical protein